MKTSPWFYRPHPIEQPFLRLFYFQLWPQGLPVGVEVVAVQLPGRGGRFQERPFTRLGPLLEALAEAISPYSEDPYAFFGHSMGALVAFELTRCLRQPGRPLPLSLFVSGRRAPSSPHAKKIFTLCQGPSFCGSCAAMAVSLR